MSTWFIAEPAGKRPPGVRGHDRNKHDQTEERLSQAGVKDSDLVFQHGDAKAAQNSLQNHAANCDQTERLDCRPLFGSPKPDCENDGEKSDSRCNQAMSMLKQNATDPL